MDPGEHNKNVETAPKPRAVLFTFDSNTKIAGITLNRPFCLNAINRTLLTQLLECLRQATEIPAIACIIAGAGTSFCSGEDLKETLAPQSGGVDATELLSAFNDLQEITRLMTKSETIFIAAVQGWAVGGGAEIALAADLVVAQQDTKFKFPEIIHGHAPTGGITGRLPQLVGLQQAKKLLLLGETITASRAFDIGLVCEVSNDVSTRTMEIAKELSVRSPRSLCTIKQSLESATFPNQEETLETEVKSAGLCFGEPQASEAYGRFLNRRNRGQPIVSPGDSLISLLSKAARSNPEKAFLRFGPIDTSYSMFLKSVQLLAAGLKDAGVQSGDVVAGMMLNSVEMVQLWFATMWIEAIWAPLHTEIRGLTLRHALTLVSPKIMIVDDVFLQYLPADFHVSLFVKVKGSSKLQSHRPFTSLVGSASIPTSNAKSSSTSSLLFTSGTTGPSKACVLTHDYFISVGLELINSLHLNTQDVLFCPFPLCHADATSLTVIPSLILQTTAAISVKFSASKWWDEIRQTKSTVADFMGATLSILFKAPPLPTDRDNSLRLMWGVPVPAWVEQFEERFNLKIYEVYGSTETGLPVVQPLDKPRVKGSCGVALENIDLEIVDDLGNRLQRGLVGELLVRQPPQSRFSGYFKDAEATRKSLKDNWFHTGDLCRMDADGNLFFIGRRKHVIRRRGENISAFEVEEAILLHPDVMECSAFGVPCELSEEDVKVSLVKRFGSTLTEKDVHQFAIETMPRFHVPRYIEFVESLPRTPTGKLEVFKLQDDWIKGKRGNTKEFEIPRRL